MNVRNLLADAFDSAASRIRNNSCGMTDQEMESALHKMLYLFDTLTILPTKQAVTFTIPSSKRFVM